MPTLIPPLSARAFTLTPDQRIRISDTAGRQPGDLVAFASDDLSIKMSQARTRVENRAIALTRGHSLWTNTLPPRVMLTITSDTGGPHDLLYPPCCRYALEKRFHVSRDGCHERLARVLERWGVRPHDLPEPLNLFFRVSVDPAGEMRIEPPASEPGSFIELRAEMPCLIAISTCSVPWPGKENSGYEIEIT